MDVWSIGCILYILLVGKCPFEKQGKRVEKNEFHYHIPSRIGPLARNLIQRLFQYDPARRPTLEEILKDDFMTMGFLPSRLPVSCLTVAPTLDTLMNASLIAGRMPHIEVNTQPGTGYNLSDLHKQLGQLVMGKPWERGGALVEDECEDPKPQPMTWVSSGFPPGIRHQSMSEAQEESRTTLYFFLR